MGEFCMPCAITRMDLKEEDVVFLPLVENQENKKDIGRMKVIGTPMPFALYRPAAFPMNAYLGFAGALTFDEDEESTRLAADCFGSAARLYELCYSGAEDDNYSYSGVLFKRSTYDRVIKEQRQRKDGQLVKTYLEYLAKEVPELIASVDNFNTWMSLPNGQRTTQAMEKYPFRNFHFAEVYRSWSAAVNSIGTLMLSSEFPSSYGWNFFENYLRSQQYDMLIDLLLLSNFLTTSNILIHPGIAAFSGGPYPRDSWDFARFLQEETGANWKQKGLDPHEYES